VTAGLEKRAGIVQSLRRKVRTLGLGIGVTKNISEMLKRHGIDLGQKNLRPAARKVLLPRTAVAGALLGGAGGTIGGVAGSREGERGRGALKGGLAGAGAGALAGLGAGEYAVRKIPKGL
jgi:outer membrane lipoprotein SlyB